jgi:hypothetical protein
MTKKTMTIFCTPEAFIARVTESGSGCTTVTREYRIHGLSIRRFYALSGGKHTAVSLSDHSYEVYLRRLRLGEKEGVKMDKPHYELLLASRVMNEAKGN